MLSALLTQAAATSAEDSHRVKERSEIDPEYLWATERMFADSEAWNNTFAEVEKQIPDIEALKGTLGQSAQSLLSALKKRDALEPVLEKVYVYASMLADQDTREGGPQGMKQRIISMYSKYGQAASWFQPELTAIPFETLDSWMRQVPELAVYRQYFDNLYRQKKYILSPREEELLAMTAEVRQTAGNAYNLLANADISFPGIKDESGEEVELDDSAFYKYMRSTDRRVRKDAYYAIVGTYKKNRNTAAALLNGAVQGHILTVKARGYDSCLQAALNPDNIPPVVYETLVGTINDNLALLHRYQQIRKKALKLDDGVRAYDLFAPLVEDQTLEYSYQDAIKTINEALQPLGGEYLSAMNNGFNSRWVDVYPTKGKRSGAYSSGTYLTDPYMLMNFHGSYEDTSTLAHEMGHSMHS
ncbi:MAG: M3 family oligoendopeptidase, partial [Phycisphaerae bacterium]